MSNVPLGLPYFAKPIGEIDNGKGYFKYQVIGIFRKEEDSTETKIGEYTRNYGSFMGTFYPFRLHGKDYALYSKDYTATRVMTLPDCQDWCGEESNSIGFCPTGYYVPCYILIEFTKDSIKGHQYRDYEPEKEEKGDGVKTAEPLQSTPFGFISGCIWGDDSSWKIEYIDLSRVAEKIIKREARFGYIELPQDMKLKQAIKMGEFDLDCSYLTIATEATYDQKTGKKCGE